MASPSRAGLGASGGDVRPRGNLRALDPVERPLFGPDECDAIVAWAAEHDSWTSAGVYEKNRSGVRLGERSVLGTMLPGTRWMWPLAAVIDAVVAVNDDSFRFELDQIPPQDWPSILRYDAGSADHFRSHRDVGAGSPTRKLTFVVQLTAPDEYAGCDLVFPNLGATSSRTQGTLLVFPSFEFHHITPIVSGLRHAIVGWVHGDSYH